MVKINFEIKSTEPKSRILPNFFLSWTNEWMLYGRSNGFEIWLNLAKFKWKIFSKFISFKYTQNNGSLIEVMKRFTNSLFPRKYIIQRPPSWRTKDLDNKFENHPTFFRSELPGNKFQPLNKHASNVYTYLQRKLS